MPFKVPTLTRETWSMVIPVMLAWLTYAVLAALLHPLTALVASSLFAGVLGLKGREIADKAIALLKLPVKPE